MDDSLYRTGSYIKFDWNANVSHASFIRLGDMFGVNPLAIYHDRLQTFTALSLPARSVATEAVRSVSSRVNRLSLFANTGCSTRCPPALNEHSVIRKPLSTTMVNGNTLPSTKSFAANYF